MEACPVNRRVKRRCRRASLPNRSRGKPSGPAHSDEGEARSPSTDPTCPHPEGRVRRGRLGSRRSRTSLSKTRARGAGSDRGPLSNETGRNRLPSPSPYLPSACPFRYVESSSHSLLDSSYARHSHRARGCADGWNWRRHGVRRQLSGHSRTPISVCGRAGRDASSVP